MVNSQSQINTRAAVKRAPAARRPPRPTTAKQNPAGLVISVLFHASLLAATYFTWSHMVPLSPETHAVPVELVVERQTNVRAEAPPPEPDKPIQDILPEPSLPAFVTAEPAPLPPVPQIKIVQPKVAVDRPDQPKSKKQVSQDVDSVLNKILAQAKTPKNAKTTDRIIQGAGNQSLSSADLVDALRSQIDRCWSTSALYAPNANDLVVDFNLMLNQDGTVAGAPQLSGNLAGYNLNNIPNPYTRAAAGAANRAIYQCAPYKLPAKRYDEWKEISPLRFDPRTAMGQ
jgi:hypothetical protein